ncbi:MAG: succinate dehydrogenase iron-sulfur subunit [Zetaproteobacteria bacterium CG12_big_fil_rev_8_21_14_0_65_55_1124]|nr:MAG: succinate dehydrogenase iron-sulfur subunit [Zetaproteobacteria bacterium CG1_02_55_237]PIS18929.1 MAG: succinate dehydrogenase iron-sulfur subunit [Zetaproteobacteria bacterium CG08_land_8_20_14_0_20_55_17]PIW42180.1 MAG: succinate dehydrogenase iron-sulfur subunit [Zetaproteobacteria bacterium CG12_big_fil_rev_8_21_14_0_65_55_1124]PIY54339.1 MAG: succinate dehydrogenase iron-sulfur subunit [Zetaproteobacteria bacterium CG_4_10_14_0_8_um_filter_55_43]PIZ38882.1 MAG: succinate dehydroge
MSETIRLEIYRYDPEGDAKPTMQAYEVPVLKPGMKLLDALNYIKWNLDGTLTYRRSCAEGVCGSDGMNINGVNGLACITDVAGLKQPIRVRPLPSMQVIRDLVVDTTHFFEQYRSIKPWLQAVSPVPEHERLQSVEERAALDGMYECVLCGCCTTSCPSWWWNGNRFLGPAALLQADRWIRDTRDEAAGQRLDALEDAFKLYRCHQIMNCMEACPKGLNPTAAINHIKRTLLARKS